MQHQPILKQSTQQTRIQSPLLYKDPIGTEVAEAHCIGSQRRPRSPRNRKEVAKHGAAIDLEVFDSKRI